MIALLERQNSLLLHPVARATDVQQGEKTPQTANHATDKITLPGELISTWLDANPDIEKQAGKGIGYREVADMISKHYQQEFDYSTVFRTIKKRRRPQTYLTSKANTFS